MQVITSPECEVLLEAVTHSPFQLKQAQQEFDFIVLVFMQLLKNYLVTDNMIFHRALHFMCFHKLGNWS